MPLARAAVHLWSGLSERLGADTGYRQSGNLRLARTEAEVATISTLVETQRVAGLELDFLPDTASVRAIAPALSETVMAASFCASDGHADPDRTVQAFLGAAERTGARFSVESASGLTVERGRVTAVTTNHRRISPGAVVLAGGVLVNELLGPLGLALPLRRPMVTVLQTVPQPPLIDQVIGVANADLALRQQVDGALRMTSGSEPWSGDIEVEEGQPVVRPTLGPISETVERIGQILPAVREAGLRRIWAGVLDLTPDALPVIDNAPGIENLAIAAGFSGHGFAIGPVTGPAVADLALGRVPAHDLSAFRFTRFSARAAEEAQAELSLHG